VASGLGLGALGLGSFLSWLVGSKIHVSDLSFTCTATPSTQRSSNPLDPSANSAVSPVNVVVAVVSLPHERQVGRFIRAAVNGAFADAAPGWRSKIALPMGRRPRSLSPFPPAPLAGPHRCRIDQHAFFEISRHVCLREKASPVGWRQSMRT